MELGNARQTLVLIAVCVLCISVLPSIQIIEGAQAKTIVVPNDYSTIQGAINAASSGDTIFVHSGTYRETIVIDKSIYLLGENKEATIIDGSRSNIVVQITADYVTFSGFKITGAADTGVYIKHSTGSTITENIIDGGHYGICSAINLTYSNQNTISNNVLTQNFEGCILTYSDSNNILNNIMEDNVENLWMLLSSHNYVDNNKFRQTSGFSSLYITNCSNNLFRRNQISQSQNWGMYLAFYSTENTFSENTFTQNKGDLLIHYCAYNTFIHNNIYVSTIDNQDCLNNWDDGEDGNYWSDYTGTGNTPYEVNSSFPVGSIMRHPYGRDYDYHPLLLPYEIVYPQDPKTQIIFRQNTTYNTDNVALILATNNPISGVTYKLDGEFGVLYENTTLQWLTNGTHTLTTYATNTNGSLALVDTVTFSVNAFTNATKPPVQRVYNYNWWPPPIPNPTLKILSPSQGQVYTAMDIILNFTVTENETYSSTNTKITRVEYVLDPTFNSALMAYTGWLQIPIASGLDLTKTYIVTLANVANGSHRLMVRVTATSNLYSPSTEVIASDSAEVNFYVNASNSGTNQGSSTSNSGTQSTSTPTPTAHTTPTPTAKPFNFNLTGNVTVSQITNFTLTTNASEKTASLDFTLTGQSGAAGFSNITIPKSILPNGVILPIVYVDGEPCLDQGYTQDASNYYVWYTIHFSTHQVSIYFTPNATTPTPSSALDKPSQSLNWLQVAIGVIVALVISATVVVALKLIATRKTQNKLC